MLRTFASDNNAPVAPEIFDAVRRANEGDAVSYGDDAVTERTLARIRKDLGASADPYLVFN